MLKSRVWEAACISHEKAGIIGVAVVSLDCSRSPEFSGDPSTDIEIGQSGLYQAYHLSEERCYLHSL